MIKTLAPTKSGFDVAIEVRDKIFNLRSVKELNDFKHIDIHDAEGNFIDEFASGFTLVPNEKSFAVNDNSAEFEANAVKVFEYIDENLVF